MKLGLALLLSMLAACGGGVSGPVCEQACLECAGGVCPAGRCGLVFVLDQSCSGMAGNAEVAVGQCLQPGAPVLGETFAACDGVNEYEDTKLTVRSDDFIWQSEFYCHPGKSGKVQKLTIYCPPEADAADEGLLSSRQ